MGPRDEPWDDGDNRLGVGSRDVGLGSEAETSTLRIHPSDRASLSNVNRAEIAAQVDLGRISFATPDERRHYGIAVAVDATELKALPMHTVETKFMARRR